MLLEGGKILIHWLILEEIQSIWKALTVTETKSKVFCTHPKTFQLLFCLLNVCSVIDRAAHARASCLNCTTNFSQNQCQEDERRHQRMWNIPPCISTSLNWLMHGISQVILPFTGLNWISGFGWGVSKILLSIMQWITCSLLSQPFKVWLKKPLHKHVRGPRY